MPPPTVDALFEVGAWLRQQGYAFTTITPESHRRVVARGGDAQSLRDVFGWSRPFAAPLLPPAIVDALRAAAVLAQAGDRLASGVRFSTLGDRLFVHSAYPTKADDAVFFGPDTYRFVRFVAANVGRAKLLVDVGAGSGAGGITSGAERIVLADINPRALAYARVNARLAGVRADVVGGDLYENVQGEPDVIIANPPYLVDPSHRRYRDGGAALGTELGVRMAVEGLARLAPGGRFLLYTGSPIVDGRDLVREALERTGALVTYEELDPDVFGEELDDPAYARADRIAAVGATLARKP